MSRVAERLRLAREQAGLSQGQVARLLGKHRPTISEIEAGTPSGVGRGNRDVRGHLSGVGDLVA